MTASSAQVSRQRSSHDRWIIAIGVFKLVQATAFILLGIGTLRLLHKDLLALAERLILALRFNPEGHFVSLILGQVALLDPHRLKQITEAIFLVAALDAIEGAGLVLEKAWAEFVTLILTASFLPWEVMEIFRRPSWIRMGLTVINLAVVLYLLDFVKKRMKQRHQRRAERRRMHAGS